MTLQGSGPISLGEIIAESSYGYGNISQQDEFVRDKISDQYRVGDVIAPKFVDDYGQVIPATLNDIKFSEFYQFDGYDDNRFIISEFKDGEGSHASRITDTGSFVLTDDQGRILRTDDKTGSNTIIKHRGENNDNVGKVFLFAEFCKRYGYPSSRVYFEFTNNGNIEKLFDQTSSWPEHSELVLINNGAITNPSSYGSYTKIL